MRAAKIFINNDKQTLWNVRGIVCSVLSTFQTRGPPQLHTEQRAAHHTGGCYITFCSAVAATRNRAKLAREWVSAHSQTDIKHHTIIAPPSRHRNIYTLDLTNCLFTNGK